MLPCGVLTGFEIQYNIILFKYQISIMSIHFSKIREKQIENQWEDGHEWSSTIQSLKEAILRIEDRKQRGIILSSSETAFLVQLRRVLEKLRPSSD
jgi:hypothetical protein